MKKLLGKELCIFDTQITVKELLRFLFLAPLFLFVIWFYFTFYFLFFTL